MCISSGMFGLALGIALVGVVSIFALYLHTRRQLREWRALAPMLRYRGYID